MAATCVVFSEEGLAITDIAPELYDTLKKRVYQDWRVWVAQVANVAWAVWKLAMSVAIFAPVVSFWMGVYVETSASNITMVLTVTGLCGVMAFVTTPRRFGVRDMFAEALSARVKHHVLALRTLSGLLSFVVYVEHQGEGRTVPSPAAARQGATFHMALYRLFRANTAGFAEAGRACWRGPREASGWRPMRSQCPAADRVSRQPTGEKRRMVEPRRAGD